MADADELVKDVRAANILAKLDRNIDDFDVEQFKEKISSPKLKPVRRFDEEALTPHVPPEAFPPLRLFSKTVDQLTSDDARNILLADLGQVFRPEIEPIEPVRGKECYVPLSERAPEALFRPDDFISYPSDIWSLACTIWDILGATSLFIGADQDVLFADQLVALGPDKLPEAWRKEWESEGPDNKPTANDEVRPPRRYRREGTYTMLPLEPRFEDDVQYWRRRAERALFDEDEKKAILDLMRGMLAFDPKCRYTIADVLESEWMIHWALPALNE
jgi:serine/threonine protein kinase